MIGAAEPPPLREAEHPALLLVGHDLLQHRLLRGLGDRDHRHVEQDPTAASQMFSLIVNSAPMVHIATLASSRARKASRPGRAWPPAGPDHEAEAQHAPRMPHTSTDTRVRPYGSSSAMNTPPRRLLRVANSTSPTRPGTAMTAA